MKSLTYYNYHNFSCYNVKSYNVAVIILIELHMYSTVLSTNIFGWH